MDSLYKVLDYYSGLIVTVTPEYTNAPLIPSIPCPFPPKRPKYPISHHNERELDERAHLPPCILRCCNTCIQGE